MNQEKIGKFIADLRKHKKLTQTELAKRIGVSNKAVSKWKCGNGIPDYGVFENLCKEFDISVNELLNGEKDMKDDKVIGEYMKIKGKENRVKIIVILVISFLVVLSSVLGIYFVNSYDKTNMYRLYGSNDDFSYTNGLLVTSNIKNILQTGDLLIKSEDIKEEDIVDRFFAVKIDDKYYKLYNYTGMYLQIEDFGENRVVPIDKVEYVPDSFYLIIEYINNHEIVVDEIKIQSKKIFSNNKFINTKVDSKNIINFEIVDFNKRFEPYKYKEQLLKEGFEETGNEELLIKKSKNEVISINYVRYALTFQKDYGDYIVFSNPYQEPRTICAYDDVIGKATVFLHYTKDDKYASDRIYTSCDDRYYEAKKFKEMGIDTKGIIEEFNDINRKYAYKGE